MSPSPPASDTPAGAGPHRRFRAGARIESARRRVESSPLQGAVTRLKALDIANWTMIIGAELLWSVLPLLILVSSLANDRIDDDLSRHIGLDAQGAHIVRGLFRAKPSHDGVAIAIGLVVSLAGAVAIARSVQEMYEDVFRQEHRGWRDLPRHLAWVAALIGALVLQALIVRSVRSAGPAVLVPVRLAAGTLFFWFTLHILLSGRVPWPALIRPAVVTAVLWLALAGFSSLFFSSQLVTDSREYGTIGVVFTLLTWLVLVAAVLALGAAGGAAWQDRATRRQTATP